jgi:hypothetical protein
MSFFYRLGLIGNSSIFNEKDYYTNQQSYTDCYCNPESHCISLVEFVKNSLCHISGFLYVQKIR